MSRSGWFGASLLFILLPGCTAKDRTPEGTVKAFLQAVEVGRISKAYEMLDPGSQKRLQDLSHMAGAQTGGRAKFKPEDMLVTGIAKARYRVGEIKAAKVAAQRAEVTVASANKQHSEVFRLRRHDGRWRIVLPTKVIERILKEPTDQPRAPKPTPAGDR